MAADQEEVSEAAGGVAQRGRQAGRAHVRQAVPCTKCASAQNRDWAATLHARQTVVIRMALPMFTAEQPVRHCEHRTAKLEWADCFLA